jgi:hypothetical protein
VAGVRVVNLDPSLVVSGRVGRDQILVVLRARDGNDLVGLANATTGDVGTNWPEMCQAIWAMTESGRGDRVRAGR